MKVYEKKILSKITVPLFEFDQNNIIKPNPLFHRPLDHLHSRCIEYPYCASKLNEDDHRILDIGTAKAARAWVSWLEQLPMKVHAIDYDLPEGKLDKIQFACADVRAIPYPDDYFDIIMAVSVIEHIGLANPQVVKWPKPYMDVNSDLEAVKEIARVLKPGGKLLMTFPFGKRARLILNNQARSYDIQTIKKFDSAIQLCKMEVFEYGSGRLFRKSFKRIAKNYITRVILSISRQILGVSLHESGLVTWEKIPIEQCNAANRWHVDAIACGVWVKNSS